MAYVTFLEPSATQLQDAPDPAAALRELGIEVGGFALHSTPVSSTPQLTYARELNALQRRYNAVMTDRVRERPAPPHPLPRRQTAEAALAWPEPGDEHTHDDLEVRVVLEGHVRFVMRRGSGWLALVCEPGAWVALPAGLPHALQASPHAGVDLLRLFSRPHGWVPEPTGASLPAALARWNPAEPTARDPGCGSMRLAA